jgi:hypothetical protein
MAWTNGPTEPTVNARATAISTRTSPHPVSLVTGRSTALLECGHLVPETVQLGLHLR